MATNGAVQSQTLASVNNALQTLQSHRDRSQKAEAHAFLEEFQKSVNAWTATLSILQSAESSAESKLFAATTLKGKVLHDLHQIPPESIQSFRDSLLSTLSANRASPKPIRTQLCVCLANLAIQMLEWKNVLRYVISALGTEQQGLTCVLEFLRVLPEEVTEGRKINLTEEDLNQRTEELLEQNIGEVLQILTRYAQSSRSASTSPLLLECITSWLREIPIEKIASSSLLESVFAGLSSEDSFDYAVESICSIFKETADVNECTDIIKVLFPRVIQLRPAIAEAAESQDMDKLKGLTRLFAEAGEAWVILIVRQPAQFRGLVEAILECAVRDEERDAISRTFVFWYDLKQLLTTEKYIEARLVYADVYSKLVDIMILHLKYPELADSKEDLFEGNREQEERFREFRHEMGDVLKDCCEVIGVTECLRKSYVLIEKWVLTHANKVATGVIPAWQELEAALFSMRAMGRMVASDEVIMLPRLIPLVLQLPDHEKVRFQAVMALGRYTEWTAQHPDTLQPQLNYIMAAFQHPSKEVIRAAALSFKFFCNDCADLLKDYSVQLQQFYAPALDNLPPGSQDDVTEGVASVLAKLPLADIYQNFKLYCDPVLKSLVRLAETAVDDTSRHLIADHIHQITIFVQWIQPVVPPGQENPAVRYCQEIQHVFSGIVERFIDFSPILEKACRCWRNMIFSYRIAIAPLLPDIMTQLALGFNASKQGCFLWATAAIVREFADGKENVDEAVSSEVFRLFQQQSTAFLRTLNDILPEELPDVIEDFFRLCADAIASYSIKTIASPLTTAIISAACTALTLLKEEPLLATLHFLRDLLAFGGEEPPVSDFGESRRRNTPDLQTLVKHLLVSQGEILIQRVMTGMMYSFPRDCVPDASGVLLSMFQLLPEQTAQWMGTTISMLPAGSISQIEIQRLMNGINQRIQSGDMRRLRSLLQDFTNSYRRRNVAPREGLGPLDATRFRFEG